jgi:hypothetical protein
MTVHDAAPLIACRIVEELRASCHSSNQVTPANLTEASKKWDINEFGWKFGERLLRTDDADILCEYFEAAQAIVDAFLQRR